MFAHKTSRVAMYESGSWLLLSCAVRQLTQWACLAGQPSSWVYISHWSCFGGSGYAEHIVNSTIIPGGFGITEAGRLLHVRLTGRLLCAQTRQRDQPGIVGAVASLLAAADVNIRCGPGRSARGRGVAAGLAVCSGGCFLAVRWCAGSEATLPCCLHHAWIERGTGSTGTGRFWLPAG
jgi:hypothetical protein